jgi:hypothetical protein
MEDQRRYKFTIANTVLKMAKKRAMVDAVLIVASLSNIFTQDMEDFDYSTTHTHTQYNKKPAKKEIKDNHKVFGALKSELIKNPEVSEGLVSMLSKDKNFENYLYKKLKFNSRLQNEAWKVFYDVKDKKGKYQTIIETIENLYESYIEEHADEAIAEATGDMA